MKKAYRWIIGLTLLSFVMVGLFLTVAPDTVPVHYNAAGEINRWSSKYEYLLFPFFSAVMGIFMGLLSRREGKQGRPDNAAVVAGVGIWVLVLFNGLWAFFLWKALKGTDLTGTGELGVKGLYLLLMAALIPAGNCMPKARRNSLFGLRTKWSMSGDTCWQKSQRIGGYLMLMTGVIGIALVALVPVQWVTYVVLGCVLTDAVVSIVATYWIWNQEQQ